MATAAAWLKARSLQERIVALAAAMVIGAIPLHLYVLRVPLPDPPMTLAWWGIALGFLITESFSLQLHVKGDAHSASFSEIPLLLGLAAASPTALIVGRALGSGVALFRNGSRGPKLAFNLALTYLDAALALTIYHSLLGAHSPGSAVGLGVGAIALGVTLIVNAGLVAVVIILTNPGRNPLEVVRSLGTGAVMSGAASAVALGGLALFWIEPLSLAAVLAAFAGLYGAFRGYGSLTRKFEDLEALHEFTSAVDGAADSDELIAVTLSQTRRLFSARFAEVVLSRGVDSTATSSEGAGSPLRRPAPPAVIEALDRHDGHERRVALLGDAPPDIAEHYRQRGIKEAMIARMNGDGHSASLLVVGSPERSRFGKDELRLLETMARQARVAFDRGRLVDRLRREMANKEHQALHDALTGLPNRLHFSIVIEDALRRVREGTGRMAVLLIDLDRFKEVNDTLGHQRGDVLLQELALRLSEAVGDDHMARLGGDEFGIVLRDVGGIAEVSEWARRIGALLQRPFMNEGLAIQVSGSIGIAVAPDHGTDGATLMRRADVAMYEAKSGGSTFEVYDNQRDRYSTRRLALAGELRDALEAGAVSVHYQPKAGLADGVVRGVEALARWLHPRHGLIPPEEFITLAEQTGLIRPLTEHVLRVAVRDRARLRAGGHALGVAVNVAAPSLGDPEFPDTVARLIAEYDVDPEAVTLEVTESTMMTDSARSRLVLASLDEIGVNLAIDDYGTGYSSLAHLSTLPVDEVKIDRSFVMDMAANERFAKIVTSTTGLVHSLGLRVVAEGVENRGTWDLLREAGCDVAQGYFVSRPLGYTDLHAWLEAGAPLQGDLRPRLHLGLAGD
ncbi:MAG TPA: EAL domain-containing protein [Acidimicrobiia bacterium]|nr:EAL domain-containing protein [Acidimicrobiia bacterium]